MQLQSQCIDQTTKFIEANILATAFNAIYFFTAQSGPIGELLL